MRHVVLFTMVFSLTLPCGFADASSSCEASKRAKWWRNRHQRQSLARAIDDPPVTRCVTRRLPQLNAKARVGRIPCEILDSLYRAIDACVREVFAREWQEEHKNDPLENALRGTIASSIEDIVQACQINPKTPMGKLTLEDIDCIFIYIDSFDDEHNDAKRHPPRPMPSAPFPLEPTLAPPLFRGRFVFIVHEMFANLRKTYVPNLA